MLRCRRWRSLPISPPSPRKSKKSFSRSLHFLLQMNAFFFSLFLSCFVTDWPFFVDFELNLFLFFLKKYFHNVWLIEFFLLIWRLNCSSLFMFYDIFYSEWNFVSFFIISSCVIVFFFCWFGGWISPFSSMFCDSPPPIRRWICDFFKKLF